MEARRPRRAHPHIATLSGLIITFTAGHPKRPSTPQQFGNFITVDRVDRHREALHALLLCNLKIQILTEAAGKAGGLRSSYAL